MSVPMLQDALPGPPPVDYWLSLADNGPYCATPSPCGHYLRGPIHTSVPTSADVKSYRGGPRIRNIGTDIGRCVILKGRAKPPQNRWTTPPQHRYRHWPMWNRKGGDLARHPATSVPTSADVEFTSGRVCSNIGTDIGRCELLKGPDVTSVSTHRYQCRPIVAMSLKPPDPALYRRGEGVWTWPSLGAPLAWKQTRNFQKAVVRPLGMSTEARVGLIKQASS